MEFVDGKYYKRRDGQRAYCIGRNPHLPPTQSYYEWAFVLDSGQAFQTDARGQYHSLCATSSDIIAEWQEPVTVTRWWFGIAGGNGFAGSSCGWRFREQCEADRDNCIKQGLRVGPIEEITTVVP